jgi:hypothetical protein
MSTKLQKLGGVVKKAARVAAQVVQDEDFQRLVQRLGYFNAVRENMKAAQQEKNK